MNVAAHPSPWPAYTVVRKPMAWLKPYAKNARTHSKEQINQIRGSLKSFGWTIPVLAREDGTIIAGHGRIEAGKAEGITEVPVIIATGWTETQCRAYALADNRVALNSGWDEQLLGVELGELSGLGIDLGTLGFDELELDTLLGTGGHPGLTDPDEAPEPPVMPVSTRGDLWALGRHRLLCGDSTVSEDIARLLTGERVDAILTDPPYGIHLDTDYSKIKGSEKATIKRAGKKHPAVIGDDRPFDAAPVLAAVGNVKEQFWFGGDYYRRTLSPSDLDGAYLVWDKRNEAADPIIGSGFELLWSKQKHKRDLLRIFQCGAFGGDSESTSHPTQKPVKLISTIIERWIKDDSLVFDPFLGSGTTIICCERLGVRRCYGIEMAPAYVDVCIKRWQDFTGEKAVLDGDGRSFDEIAAERVKDAA